ncbi:hypothetical protein [Burkholderia savannae]|uniref:hypothetical protein n=1 Tax=Burkholderia savannae TaxID=1637837 RepID=UPI0012F526D6|nr:hypothetical protein [Burkholderia savannae]
MSTPWLPPYLGSWDDLVKALLHNPSLGGGHPHHLRAHLAARASEPPPTPWFAADPEPNPWSPATSFLISAIGLNQVARQMPEGQPRRDLSRSVDVAIADFIDDWCGTRPPGRPWPWPGPNPLTATLVSELGVAAQSFDGAMREEVLQVAGRIVQKSFAPEAAGQ